GFRVRKRAGSAGSVPSRGVEIMAANGLTGAVAPDDAAPLSRWQKLRLIVKVVELRLRFVALMAITGLVFAYWDTLWNHYEKYTRPREEAVVAASEHEYF